MPQGAATERDALDRWFDRCTRSWWRRWRWFAFAVILLLVIRIAYDLWSSYVMSWAVDQGLPNVRTDPQFQLMMTLFRYTRGWLGFERVLWWGAAVLLGSTYALSLTLPADLALAIGPRQAWRASLAASRRVFWFWLFLLVFVLPAIMEVASYINPVIDIAWTAIEVAGVAFPAVIRIGLILCVTELQLAVLLRIRPGPGSWLLYCLPLLTTLFAITVSKDLSFRTLTDFAPDYIFGSMPFMDDPWIVQSHIFLVVVGMLAAIAIWPWLIRRASPALWYSAFGAICLGLVLPGLIWHAGSAAEARAAHNVTAAVRGVYIGNPFLGWSKPDILGVSPYGDDWDKLKAYSDAIVQSTTLPDNFGEMWELGTSNYGMVFAPKVYFPLYAAILWAACYYAFSLWILARANNKMPKGYTGTWQE